MKKSIALAMMIAFTGIATAQPPAGDKKTTTPTTPAKPDPAAKAAPPAGKEAKPEPAKMPEMKPPAEVAAMAKAGAGNWKCEGKMAMDPTNAANMTPFKGTFKQALDPTKYWIKGDWAVTGTKMKGTMYTTYDPAAKKWYRHGMDNMGSGGMSWSTGLPAGATEGKVVWEGEHHGMGMQHKMRTTEEVAAKSIKITSEASMDGGKTWKTGMELTCTK